MRPSILLVLSVLFSLQPAWAASPQPDPLQAGFNRMYELKFHAARRVFHTYIQQHPDNPMGQVSLAASFLFEEFNEHGVLTPAFFLNDKKLLGGIPDAGKDRNQAEFLKADARAQQMARQRLKSNPNDKIGLYALTLANGMEADYDALIAKRDLDSLMLLHKTKQLAHRLLTIDSDADDAYLALGAANYIIGCLPGYKRFFLSFGGIHGSRSQGIHQLRLAAEHGRYLKPFAKVMLALAELREKHPQVALKLFRQLHAQFPENHVFSEELAKLQ